MKNCAICKTSNNLYWQRTFPDGDYYFANVNVSDAPQYSDVYCVECIRKLFIPGFQNHAPN